MLPALGPGDYARQILPWAPDLLGCFVVLFLAGVAVFAFLIPDIGTTMAVSGLVALAGFVVLTLVSVSRPRGMLTGTTVVASPTGVELRDRLGFVVRLRWSDITGIGTVEDSRGPSARLRHVGRRLDTIRVNAPIIRSQGLISWGQRWIPQDAPSHLRKHLAKQPRDPATGKEEIAISFSAAGRADASNPLLAHLRHYRPDLFR